MKRTAIKSTMKFLLAMSTLPLLFFPSAATGMQEKKVTQDLDFKITPKIINAKLYKRNEDYETKRLEIVIDDFRYFASYERWKEKYYNGKIVSFRNESLGYFLLPNGLFVVECHDSRDKDDNLNGGCHSLPEGELTIQLPYFPNGKYADIYDPYGKKVLTIDLSSKATCNENGQCDQPVEDSENCPQDCKNQESKLDPILVEKAEKSVAESEKESASNFSWWVLLVEIVLLLGGGSLGYYTYRKNRGFEP